MILERRREGPVEVLTLNRPEVGNALSPELLADLGVALAAAQADGDVRAIVLTGAGDRIFCAGMDLKAFDHKGSGAPAPSDDTAAAMQRALFAGEYPKPVIAAVNGSAAGAGASLALACDFRVAARRASLLMAFARVGLAADSGASVTLQRLAGAAKATELLMLAEPVDAEHALAAGLFTTVVADDEVMPEATRLARRLADGPTAAYGGIKAQLLYSATHDLAESLDNEARVQAELGKTADHRAATLAFTRKERPSFQGS